MNPELTFLLCKAGRSRTPTFCIALRLVKFIDISRRRYEGIRGSACRVSLCRRVRVRDDRCLANCRSRLVVAGAHNWHLVGRLFELLKVKK